MGLRFTLNRMNVEEVPGIFDLLEEVGIPRVCFYHLVYAGRGSDLVEHDLNHAETRRVVDLIIDRTKDLHDRGLAEGGADRGQPCGRALCLSEHGEGEESNGPARFLNSSR